MRHILTSAIVISLLAGGVLSPAFADSRHDRGDRHERRWDGRRDHDRHDRRADHRHRDGYRYDRHDYPSYRYDRAKRFYGGSYYRPHGYRYYSWRRGDRLPVAYYAPRYVIRDYRAYRLYAPPRGYHWVRVDRDVVLAAITTGVVLGVVSDLFH